MESPNYYRLRNTSRDTIPARVALLLPFSSTSADARNIANARIGYTLPGNHVTLSVFGENIFDDQKPRTLNDISADIFETPYVRLDEPATFGVELGLKF